MTVEIRSYSLTSCTSGQQASRSAELRECSFDVSCEPSAYLAEDFKELHDVDDPGTETGGRLRLGPYELRVEVLVVEVRLDRPLTHLRDVLLVIVDQRRQKLVNLKNNTIKGSLHVMQRMNKAYTCMTCKRQVNWCHSGYQTSFRWPFVQQLLKAGLGSPTEELEQRLCRLDVQPTVS